MKNLFKSLFTLAFILMSVVFSVSIAQAKGKEPQPFTKDTVFMTKNVVMYAEGDTLKYVTKQLSKIQIKNGVITCNGNVLTNGKAVKAGKNIRVSWVNKNGFRIVYTGSPERKSKPKTAKAQEKENTAQIIQEKEVAKVVSK